MRKIIYYVATSLDGFIARADGSFDFFVNDDELVADFFASLKSDYGAVVMGRATYEVGLAAGVTNPYPWLDTHVVSRSMEASPDEAISIVRELDAVEALRRGVGDPIWLCGGGELATAMMSRGLIDELVLKVNPVVLGEGIPLFRGLERPFVLASLGAPKVYASGIVVSRFAVEP